MHYKYAFIFIIALNSSLFGQDTSNLKWQIGLNLGCNFPLTKLLNGEPFEHLLYYNDASTYWRIPSLTYFFNKKLGIELNVNWSESSENADIEARFLRDIELKYGNQYFTTIGKFSFDSYTIQRGFGRFYLGLVHRFEKSRFVFDSKIFIGVTSFHSGNLEVRLKEKNSNNLYIATINAGKIGKDIFTTAVSSSINYKLTKRVYLNLDFIISYCKSDIIFYENLKNLSLNSDETTILLNQKKDVFNLSVGAGIVVPFNIPLLK